jgi:hypothetical protein
MLFARGGECSSGTKSFVVVVNGNRKSALSLVLTNYILFEESENLFRLRKFDIFKSFLNALTKLFFDDFVAEFNALVANEYSRSGN